MTPTKGAGISSGKGLRPSSWMYLDYNATTPLAPEVIEAVMEAMKNAWGNPSSSHETGVAAKNTIAEARSRIAVMLGADSEDIIFTSGGTESNSMVLQTALKSFQRSSDELPHIITSNLEHDSVRIVLEKFVQDGLAEVTFVPASLTSGRVEVDTVTAAVKPNTCLVSIMMANNETGVIQPIEDISRAVKALNHGPRQILMHTDAAQCIGKIPVRVPDLAVDYLTVVGHKFYGPRIGALYVRKPGSKTPLLPIFYGGGQERNFRSGTENTPMIAGLGMAAHLVCENLPRYQNMMKESRDQMEYMLRKLVTNSSNPGLGISINGKYASSQRLPNTLNFAFVGANSAKTLGRSVLEKVSDLQAGVGAACHSGSGVRASPVLLASGVPEEAARNAIRLSFGREEISVKDIQSIAERLCNAAESLQQASE